ncbi:endoplasmic reticulum-Golgi intermediate compartment protein 1-like [Argonauta hians]
MQFDIRRLDLYRKVPHDLTHPTITGAIISLISLSFIGFLIVSELSLFITIDLVNELSVGDPVSYTEKIPVFLNVTLPRLKCEYAGIDIQDEMGRRDVGIVDSSNKIEINNGVGCRYEANFRINKVPGNFHISTHSANPPPSTVDMGHTIHEVRFGHAQTNPHDLKGSFNPLKDVERHKSDRSVTFDYIIRVVPTVYQSIDEEISYPFQYTYTTREINFLQGSTSPPAIWFRYDLSPITVRYHERRRPFYTFLTTVCAIVGGTFTVVGLIDSVIFTASEIIRKSQLGKLT